jgi:uncharacterized damage-inducible protein DinB
VHATEPLADAVVRIRDQVRDAAGALDPDQLAWQVRPGANHIGWLLWHLTRVEDAHVAEFLEEEQLYISEGWAEALSLAPDPHDSGYGHTPEQVAALRIEDPTRLVAYQDAVAARTLALLDRLSDAALDEVIDESWDPPVTAGVRWISIVEDCFQHLGQIGYVRGLLP